MSDETNPTPPEGDAPGTEGTQPAQEAQENTATEQTKESTVDPMNTRGASDPDGVAPAGE